MASVRPTTRSHRSPSPSCPPALALPTSTSSPSSISQLVTAIRCNDLLTFSSILETPALDVNCHTPQGDAPLVEACRYARYDMARLLLMEHHANVNVSSNNKSTNRVGLTPLVAACMALKPQLVALLLTESSSKVNLLKTYGRVNAATVCLLFCVANGRTDEQNEMALEILQQLLDYAAQHQQLEALLGAKADKVNSMLHVAAGLSNWKALRMLRDKTGVDFGSLNALQHSALRVVETNAFQGRSFLFCRPPRTERGAGRGKRGKGRKKSRKRGPKEGGEEEKREITQEDQSAADEQTFTRSRPDRAVEAYHVTRTVMELVRHFGIGAVFSRKRDEGLEGIYLKALVLAEVGIVSIVNEIARMSDAHKEKTTYIDGLMSTVASLYPLSVKNTKTYQSLWHQALDKKSTADLSSHSATDKEDEEEEKPSVSATEEHTSELSHAAFKLIMSRMFTRSSLAKRIKVWTLVLMHVIAPFANKSPLAANDRLVMEECGQIQFYTRITEMIYRSGTKLAFCIFDRTDIEDDESYDEEIEFHLLISLFELFLQFYTPYARTISDGNSKNALGVAESFQRAIGPVKQLWPLMTAALNSLDDVIATPQRFSLLLHILQVFEQLEAAFVHDESAALKKLFGIMNRFVKQEANRKRLKKFVADQTHLMRTIATSFPLPLSFTGKVVLLKKGVDVLIRSDAKVLGMDLYSFTSIPEMIRLEHKVDYLAMLAEECNGSVSVSINRASEANFVDFISQQVLSTSITNLKGQMNITLVNEPGVGVGVTREFFQIVQKCFFRTGSTTKSLHGRSLSVELAPHVLGIGTQWLQRARLQSEKLGKSRSNTTRARQSRPAWVGSFAELFPLFHTVNNEPHGALCIAPRTVYISKQIYDTKRSEKSLSLTRKDVLVDPNEGNALERVYLCIGRLIGLAIRNHQPLGADFPLVFWQFMMRDGSLTWESYCENCDVFRRSLQLVLDHDFDAEPLDLRFDYTLHVVVVDTEASASSDKSKQQEPVTDEAASPLSSQFITTSMEMELQEDMGDVEVTNANKLQYVLLRAQQFFFANELVYYKKMRDGFIDTIRPSDLKLFRPEELRRLVRGERVIDFEDLKKNVVYSCGASSARGVVQQFWKVAETFDQDTRSKLLTFWSGSPLPPIFGFDSKYRSMSADTACWYIDVDVQMQPNCCPMANTCDRRLILPDYPNSAALKEKLLVALEHGSVGYDRI